MSSYFGPQQGLSFTRLAKSANYTVANGDKGSNFALGGNAFFTLTFSAASGYDPNFAVSLTNEDGWTSGRAKFISLSGGGSFMLWPTQTAFVWNSNNVWQVHKTRAKLPNTSITFNTDFTNGSDTYGVSDGLSTGSSAYKSVGNAISQASNEFDWASANGVTQVTILMAASSTDSTPIHLAFQGLAGVSGARGITIDGNTSGTLSGGIQVFFNGVLEIQNVTITNASGSGLTVTQGGRIYLQTGVTFGACSGVQLNADTGGEIYIVQPYTVSGAGQYHALAGEGGQIISAASGANTISANITYSQQVVFCQTGVVDLSGLTWTLGGHTVTGTKYLVQYNGVFFGITNIPGSVAGSTNTGGQAA